MLASRCVGRADQPRVRPVAADCIEELREDLSLPTFSHEDVRVVEPRAFCPPLTFSTTTLATYIDQRPPRLTQRHEIFKVHKDEMDQFFGQIWGPDSELFSSGYFRSAAADALSRKLSRVTR